MPSVTKATLSVVRIDVVVLLAVLALVETLSTVYSYVMLTKELVKLV